MQTNVERFLETLNPEEREQYLRHRTFLQGLFVGGVHNFEEEYKKQHNDPKSCYIIILNNTESPIRKLKAVATSGYLKTCAEIIQPNSFGFIDCFNIRGDGRGAVGLASYRVGESRLTIYWSIPQDRKLYSNEYDLSSEDKDLNEKFIDQLMKSPKKFEEGLVKISINDLFEAYIHTTAKNDLDHVLIIVAVSHRSKPIVQEKKIPPQSLQSDAPTHPINQTIPFALQAPPQIDSPSSTLPTSQNDDLIGKICSLIEKMISDSPGGEGEIILQLQSAVNDMSNRQDKNECFSRLQDKIKELMNQEKYAYFYPNGENDERTKTEVCNHTEGIFIPVRMKLSTCFKFLQKYVTEIEKNPLDKKKIEQQAMHAALEYIQNKGLLKDFTEDMEKILCQGQGHGQNFESGLKGENRLFAKMEEYAQDKPESGPSFDYIKDLMRCRAAFHHLPALIVALGNLITHYPCIVEFKNKLDNPLVRNITVNLIYKDIIVEVALGYGTLKGYESHLLYEVERCRSLEIFHDVFNLWLQSKIRPRHRPAF